MNLATLNPRNSFFGRIFLWFWFMTLTSLATGIVVARLLSPDVSISTANGIQQQLLHRVTARFEMRAKRGPEALFRQLQQFSGRDGRLAFAVNLQTEQFLFGFPPPNRPPRDTILELINSPELVHIRLGATQFVGPAMLEMNNQQYALFVGNDKAKRGHRLILLGAFILVVLVISGVFCFWLARSFARPVREIQAVTQAIASGKLDARVVLSDGRADELGLLSTETNNMAEQLQTLIGEHHRFLADISHELRSPLTRMQLAIGIAEDSPSPQHALKRVAAEADQMERMIAQLLYLSRQQIEMSHPDLALVALDDVLLPCVHNAEFEAQSIEKHFTLQRCEQTEGLMLNANPELLASALENVCRNAIKYATTTITLMVTINKLGDADALILSITDDGPGVPSSELQMLFKPFYRLDNSRSRDSGGVGLGLSIAQRAIQYHGGTIVASHHEPTGLAVTMTVPITNE